MEAGERHTRFVPAAYMIGFVIIFSVVPLVIDKGLNGSNPLLFNAGLAVGKIIGVSVWLAIACPRVIFNSDVLYLIRKRTFSKAMVLGSTSHFTYALFAWSTTYVDTAVSTIVYETWPILYMTLLIRLGSQTDGESRYRRLSVVDYSLCGLAFLGLAYVTLGTSSVQEASSNTHIGYQTLGLVLAIGAAGIASLNAFNFQWGCDLRKHLPKQVAPEGSRDIEELACVMIAFALSSLLVLPGSVALGLFTGGGISTGPLLISILAGAGLLSAGSVCFRRANLQTRDPAVNALSYTAPVAALGWLAAFSDIDVANKEYLVIGTTAIVAMNLLLNVDPEESVDDADRLGFRALVASLWVFGAVVHSRDSWLTLDRLVWSTDQYWGILALSATVFTLILSFRVNRVANRTSMEDQQTASILRKLENLHRQKVIERQAIDRFASMGQTTAASIRDAYDQLRSAIYKARRSGGWSREDLLTVEVELDMLIYSKQRGREFGELVAIVSLGVITVGIAILSRPPLEGWSGFLAEMFVMTFCSTIVYLIVNLADLRRERFARVFRQRMLSKETHASESDYSVNLHEEDALRLDSIVALIVSVAVVVAFGYVLLEKWLG